MESDSSRVEERARKEELVRLAQLNRRILDAVPHSILMLDENLTVLDANRYYLERRQKNVPPVFNHIRDALSPDLVENTGLLDALNECLRTGAPKQLDEIAHKNEDNETRWLNIRIYPLEKFEHSREDAQPRLIVIINDVTGYVEMRNGYQTQNDKISLSNQELQSALDQLREAQAELLRSEKLASVGQLAAGVAHEINNPIAYILSNLRTLSTYQQEFVAMLATYKDLVYRSGNKALIAEMEHAERQAELDYLIKDCASILEENIEGTLKIRNIVRDLSTFSHMEYGKAGMVNVNDLIDSAIRIVFNEIKHHARLRKKFHAVPEINADSSQLGQVFLNLLLNAVHAIPEGHAESNTITIESAPEEENIIVTVQDTGRGISEQNLSKIFDPFFTTKDVGEGTGLGLSISLNLVRRHGGDIQVKSKEGEGSIFRVVLPIKTGIKPAESALRLPPAHETDAAAGKRRVLLIDDDERIIKSYVRILKPYYDLVTAQGGKKGIKLLLKDQDFDAILCDLMMPDTDGVAVHDFLLKKHPHLAAKIIFFTGGAFTAQAKKFVETVPNNILEKPVDFPLLFSLISKVSESPKTPKSSRQRSSD